MVVFWLVTFVFSFTCFSIGSTLIVLNLWLLHCFDYLLFLVNASFLYLHFSLGLLKLFLVFWHVFDFYGFCSCLLNANCHFIMALWSHFMFRHDVFKLLIYRKTFQSVCQINRSCLCFHYMDIMRSHVNLLSFTSLKWAYFTQWKIKS